VGKRFQEVEGELVPLGQEGRAGSGRGRLTPSLENASEPQGGGL